MGSPRLGRLYDRAVEGSAMTWSQPQGSWTASAAPSAAKQRGGHAAEAAHRREAEKAMAARRRERVRAFGSTLRRLLRTRGS